MEKINESVMLPVGKTLQMGKYRVEKHLSSGGFGNTYVVTNTQFEEHYAMKEFFMKGINERDGNNTTVSVSNAANRSQFYSQQEKFRKEARRLRKLRHRHIVSVEDLFDENGTTYYVMDFVEGGSLAEQVKRRGQLSEQRVRQLLPALLGALKYVHSQGIWHLDLKPGNILLNKSNEPVLIDFGASKQLGNQGGESTSTAMAYTKGYAPTEQIDQNLENIGPWTDLYALGGTLYNLLTGKTPPTVSAIQDGDAFSFPASVNAPMRQLIEWLMTPSRRKRPQSVDEVSNYLNNMEGEAEGDNDDTGYDEPESADDYTSYDSDAASDGNSGPITVIVPKYNIWKFFRIALAVAVLGLMCYFFIPANCRGGEDSYIDADTLAVDSIADDELPITRHTFTSDIGTYEYEGDTDDEGRPNGRGKAWFEDGRYYDGMFKDGKMEGLAHFEYGNGDVFEGSFSDNYFLQGRYTVKDDGSYYIGTFKDGKPDKGQWYDKNGKEL